MLVARIIRPSKRLVSCPVLLVVRMVVEDFGFKYEHCVKNKIPIVVPVKKKYPNSSSTSVVGIFIGWNYVLLCSESTLSLPSFVGSNLSSIKIKLPKDDHSTF